MDLGANMDMVVDVDVDMAINRDMDKNIFEGQIVYIRYQNTPMLG
jgi:hypothetical protein